MDIIKSLLFILLCLIITNSAANFKSANQYTEAGQGIAKFDISKSIDATGYTLKGYHLEGGKTSMNAMGSSLTPFLSFEQGTIQLPTSTNLEKQPYIQTQVTYFALKISQDPLFIKVGLADRHQVVANLDPSIIKEGQYEWRVPFFSFGMEHPLFNHQYKIQQFTQIGGIEKSNAMYTKQITIISQGKITGAFFPSGPSRVNHSPALFQYWTRYYGYGDINWKAFGDTGAISHGEGGPIESTSTAIKASSQGSLIKGIVTLPTLQTYWSAPKEESGHCPNRIKGCVMASIASDIKYKAIMIHAPLFLGVKLFALSGMGFRQLIPNNVRIDRNVNVYVKKEIPERLNLKVNYTSGGYKAPFFAFGIKFPLSQVTAFILEYAFFPLNENSNRLSWNDAPNAKLFFYGVEVNRQVRTNNQEK